LRLDLLLLEAGAAQYRPALCRLERNRGFRTAVRTSGACLRPHPGAPAGALRLALLAALGVVLELFVVEEELLAGCENEFGAAIDALQNSVCKVHGRLPLDREER